MANEKETVLAVEGMTCSACVRHVTAALSELPGIEKVEVELETRKVRIAHGAEGTSTDEMIAALNGAGYEAREP
jgi:copper chaperone